MVAPVSGWMKSGPIPPQGPRNTVTHPFRNPSTLRCSPSAVRAFRLRSRSASLATSRRVLVLVLMVWVLLSSEGLKPVDEVRGLTDVEVGEEVLDPAAPSRHRDA